MEEFACLDILLLAFGCKVYRDNCFVTFVNNVFLAIIILCYIVTPLISIESRLQEHQQFQTLSMIDRYSDELFGFLAIYFLRKHRKPLGNLLITISGTLSPTQRRSLRRHAVCSLIFVFVIVIQECLVTTYHVTRPNTTTLHAIAYILLGYHSLNSWFVGGCLTMAFLVKIVKFNEVNYFEQLEKEESTVIEENAPRLALERWKCMLFKKNLLKPFSIIPCFWFAQVFIKTLAIWMQVGYMDDVVGKVSRILPLAYQLLAVTYVVYHCDTCGEMTRKRVHDTIMWIMRENRMQGMDVFVTRLDSSGVGIHMCNKVYLNRRFLLAFACSLISFVFLFREVTNMIRQKERQDIYTPNPLPSRTSSLLNPTTYSNLSHH